MLRVLLFSLAVHGAASLRGDPRLGRQSHARRFSRNRALAADAARADLMPPAEVATPLSELAPPAEVARRLFSGGDARPIILYDGVCNLCNGGVNLALDWDPEGFFRFAALQSDVGRSLLMHHGRAASDISSIVLVDEQRAALKSEAVLRIAQRLPRSPFGRLLAPSVTIARALTPRFLADAAYDVVATNRYRLLGKRDSCRLDDDGEFARRFVPDDLAKLQPNV